MSINYLKKTDGSSMVMLMKKWYLSSEGHLDFTYGYPERINPSWIKKLQTSVPEEVFLNEDSATTFIRKIETYFLNLFQAPNISITPTAGFAIAFMSDALVRNRHDEIILQDVSFECYPKIIESYKGTAVVAARGANFSLSPESIKAAYTKNTKALLVVNPDNPLGLIYSQKEMKELVDFCINKNITLVVDYAFFQISPFGKKIPLITTFNECDQLSYILIGDTGKILGLKGSKFGFLLYSENWKEIIDEILSNYLFQYDQYNLYLISTILTDNRFNQYLKYLNSTVAENYLFIKNNLHPTLKVLPFDGAVFCLIDLEATGLTDIALTHSLRTRGIGVIPVTYFYQDSRDSPEKFIRVALTRPLTEIKKFTEVINHLVTLGH
jgi:aspartate/methionine/tyrosine aminotransferase